MLGSNSTKELPKYRSIWHFREDEYTTFVLTQKLEVVIIELEKVIEFVRKNKLDKNSKIALWTNFLLNPREVEENVMSKNEDIKMANDRFEEIISDETEQRRALSRQMYYMDMNSAKKEGFEEGIEQGIEQGMEQGIKQGKKEGKDVGKKESQIETAKKMLRKNYTIEEIVEISGLSEEEIKALKNSVNNKKII